MSAKIHFEPIIGWGNRRKEDTACTISLHEQCKFVTIRPTPELECELWENYLWWHDDLTLAGISSGDRSATWDMSEAGSYICDIWYPTEFAGSCGFGVAPEPLKPRACNTGKPVYSRPDQFIFVTMPYSSASLEKLLRITSVISQTCPKPTHTFQSSDSRF